MKVVDYINYPSRYAVVSLQNGKLIKMRVR
jgi:hypothetical protein